MRALKRGERMAVGGPDRQAVVVDVHWSPVGASVGVYVLLLDATARILSREHVMYADKPTAPDGATLLREGQVGDKAHAQIVVHLAGTDGSVHRLRFVLAVNQGNATLANVGDVEIAVWDPSTGETDGSFASTGHGVNKCLVLAEVIRGAGGWEFQAEGELFPGAISDLANRIGLST